MQKRKYLRLGLVLALAVVVFTGCPKSPEEQVEKLRSYYTARVIGIIVDAVPEPEESLEDPLAEPSEMASPEMSPEDDDGVMDGGDNEGMEAETTVPTRQTVRVDILIQHDSPEKLPGVTLDLEMVDAQQAPKASWKVWVDTSELPKATGSQFSHVLEDIEYVDGDGFSVEVRSYVPPEDRAGYKEFSVAAAE